MTLSNLRSLTVPALLTLAVILVSALLVSSTKGHLLSSSDLRLEVARFRPLEAQLSVGQHYNPCEVVKVPLEYVPWSRCQVDPRDSSVDAKTILKTVSAIDARDPWSSGLAYLLWIKDPANLDRAIERLERAHDEAPIDSARANDLAAALIERAGRQNQPADLVAALELLEKALRDGSSEPWLIFNRALVLEKLRLLALAHKAWLHYLDDYPKSPWEPEAQDHFVEVTSYIAAQAEPVNQQLLAAAKTVDTHQLEDIANRYPRETREFAIEVALKQWAESLLAGRMGEAERWRDTVRYLGEELVRLGGDHTVLEAAEEIESIQGRPEKGRKLAQGFQLYGSGHQLFQERDYPRADPLLRAAWSQLTALGSPLAGWALFDLGAIELYRNNNQGAVALLSPLLENCDSRVYPSLCGRAAWGKGLGLFRLGRLDEALTAYRASAMAFLPTRERDNHAGALGLVAETLRELGDTSSAWQYRYQGLRVLGGQTRHRSNHNLLWEGGEAALEEGYPLAAELFADEDVELFGGGADRLLALESYLRRAQFRRGRAPVSLVLADLDRAVAFSHELPNSPLLPRIEADVQLALAQMAVERAPYQAEEALGRTVRFFRQHDLVLREAATLLIKGRLAKAQGRIRQAQSDLEAAIALFEARRDQLVEDDQQLYNETWQGVYDELIELAATRRDGVEDALRLLESSRGSSAHQDLVHTPTDPNMVILAFAVHRDALYRFQIEAGAISLAKFAVKRTDLAAKVHELVRALRFGSAARNSSEELSSLLVPADLPAGAILCVVPDRELSGIPFSALSSQTNLMAPLITKHEILLATSVHDCEVASRHQETNSNKARLLLVQSPRLDHGEFPSLSELPAAPDETAALLRIYPDLTLLANEKATTPALLGALPAATIFHFAGHAVVHRTQPRRSFIPLAADLSWPRASLLSASEIANLHLPNLQLVVLSACNTLTPQTSRTYSVSGLVGAFLDAGSPAVIGALWEIHDSSSQELMADFYHNFNATNDAAFSLRAAQLHVYLNPASRLRSRGTWAAFELVVKLGQRNKPERRV